MFILAAKNGPAAALSHLLSRGFDAEARSIQDAHATALILAAASERDAAEKVRLLLKNGAKVDNRDDEGTTALLAASRAGNMRAVIALAEAGANVNIADDRGMTPLLYVANRGDSMYMCPETGGEAARALIRHGATVGKRAKGLAGQIKHTEVLDVLNEAGLSAQTRK
jgi:hypothetical protein